MTQTTIKLADPGIVRVAGAPEGADALALAALATARQSTDRRAEILHVARDDARMARLEELLAFFAPDIELLSFPAWDCLPYDRVSPHRDIVGRREFVCRWLWG